MKQIAALRITFGVFALLFALVVVYTTWNVFGAAADHSRRAERPAPEAPKDGTAAAGDECSAADALPLRVACTPGDRQPGVTRTPRTPTLAPPRPIEQVRGEVLCVTVEVETRRPVDALR